MLESLKFHYQNINCIFTCNQCVNLFNSTCSILIQFIFFKIMISINSRKFWKWPYSNFAERLGQRSTPFPVTVYKELNNSVSIWKDHYRRKRSEWLWMPCIWISWWWIVSSVLVFSSYNENMIDDLLADWCVIILECWFNLNYFKNWLS